VGQTGGAEHERETERQPVKQGFVGERFRPGKAELLMQIGYGGTIAELGQQPEIAQLAGQQHQRKNEGHNQYEILQLLVTGHSHGAGNHHQQHDHGGPQNYGRGVIDAEQPGSQQGNTAKLGHAVDHGNQDGYERHQGAGVGRLVAEADKIGCGKFAEAADLAGHQHQQEHISSGPADDEGHGVIALQVEHPRQSHETGGTHPVAGNGGTDANPTGVATAESVLSGLPRTGTQTGQNQYGKHAGHNGQW